MGYAKPAQDRRSHERVGLDRDVVVFQRGDAVGRYALHDLCAGGALITGERDLGRGHLVHLLFALDGAEPPMSISASVHEVRDAAKGIGLALTFPSLSPDQEDQIQDAVLRSLVRDRFIHGATVLVFEPRGRVRAELENEIRSFGMQVESTPDLMDAVHALEDDDTEYSALVVHSAAYDRESMDVIEFFAKTEGLRTVILPEPGHRLPAQALRLARLPHVSVPQVWNRDALRGVLGH